MSFTVQVDLKNGTRSFITFDNLPDAVAYAARSARDERVTWSAVNGLGMDATPAKYLQQTIQDALATSRRLEKRSEERGISANAKENFRLAAEAWARAAEYYRFDDVQKAKREISRADVLVDKALG